MASGVIGFAPGDGDRGDYSISVIGQPITIPISVRDLDQDALTFSAPALPNGASLTPQIQYGQALFTWTPTADDVGRHDPHN
jgi:hypothetical protein